MKLSIITLTHNHLEYTRKYVESLYKYTKDFELILVDNGSTDGTLEYIKSLPYKNIKTIYNKENQGFSKGNNQGIKIAEGEFIGFLNNDILLYPNWFEECEKVFEKENAAFVSPRHINPHYDNTNEHKFIKYFENNFKYKNNYEKSFDCCEFSCVITKREIINSIGIFDENYTPAFFEDNDFKYRAIEAGYGVFVCNNVCFYHFGSVTSIKFNKNFEANKNYYYNKYKYAAYLSQSAFERDEIKKYQTFYNKCPVKLLFKLFILTNKIKNRIIKLRG